MVRLNRLVHSFVTPKVLTVVQGQKLYPAIFAALSARSPRGDVGTDTSTEVKSGLDPSWPVLVMVTPWSRLFAGAEQACCRHH